MRTLLRLLPLPALLLIAPTARAQGAPNLPPWRPPHPFTDSAWATAPLALGGVHRCGASCLAQAPDLLEVCQAGDSVAPPGPLHAVPMPTARDTSDPHPAPMPTARPGTDPAPVPMPGAHAGPGRAITLHCPGATAYVY